MSSRVILWTDHARKELQKHMLFWELITQSTQYSKRLIGVNDLQIIQRFPSGFVKTGPGINRTRVLRFHLYYSYDDERIVILDFRDSKSQTHKQKRSKLTSKNGPNSQVYIYLQYQNAVNEQEGLYSEIVRHRAPNGA
jgi:hypothetical protein